MKVLFICSGNNAQGVGILVKNQAISLNEQGIIIDFFTIVGKGWTGYLANVVNLRKLIKKNKYDLFHAHFSYSAFAATLAGCNPLVVSLMGSDTYRKGMLKYLIKTINRVFWKAVIVKSESMKKSLKLRNCSIIPNGVNLDKFHDGYNTSFKNKYPKIIFVGNPERPEKNYKLAKSAIDLLKIKVNFLTISNVEHDELPAIMNEANVLLLTSLYEGSPNVIKEAMACNLPIVSTNVGDVKKNLGNLQGHFITSFTAEDVANKLTKALKFEQKTKGRIRLMNLGLDSKTVSKKIIDIYNSVLVK